LKKFSTISEVTRLPAPKEAAAKIWQPDRYSGAAWRKDSASGPGVEFKKNRCGMRLTT
jgi:hypothetical protein